jgi:hypothetical protein
MYVYEIDTCFGLHNCSGSQVEIGQMI